MIGGAQPALQLEVNEIPGFLVGNDGHQETTVAMSAILVADLTIPIISRAPLA